MTRAIWLVSVGALVLAGCKHAEPPPVNASTVEEERNTSVQAQPTAPLFEGLGDFSHAITTSNGKTQRYFDQGMVLSFGFNHAEAERSFRHAAALDEGCAMCWWGVAYVLGPNINAPMSPEAGAQAWEALQRAQALAPNVSPEEQDYITALATRYAETPTEDRTSLNEAYAEAMKALSAKYPNDVDARVLAVEALMDLHPWDFWDLKTGKAQPWTPEIVSMLEDTLARAPNHPMANHLYIHLVEASHEPERALPSAKRLPELTPGAGHLVHMPAHVYIRVGEYHEASEANEAAIEADQAYITQCRAQGIYPLAYHPHNYHFLSRTASLEGRSAKALEAANRMKAHVPTDEMRQPGLTTLQHYWVTPLYVMAQFGMWDRILSYPKPEDDLVYPIGVWHYARGLAFTANDRLAKANAELTELVDVARGKLTELSRPIHRSPFHAPSVFASIPAKVAKVRLPGERNVAVHEPTVWPVRHTHAIQRGLCDLFGRWERELARITVALEKGWALGAVAARRLPEAHRGIGSPRPPPFGDRLELVGSKRTAIGRRYRAEPPVVGGKRIGLAVDPHGDVVCRGRANPGNCAKPAEGLIQRRRAIEPELAFMDGLRQRLDRLAASLRNAHRLEMRGAECVRGWEDMRQPVERRVDRLAVLLGDPPGELGKLLGVDVLTEQRHHGGLEMIERTEDPKPRRRL